MTVSTSRTKSVAAAVIALASLCACSRRHESVEEERRRLLTPVDTEKAAAVLEEKNRLFDASGELLASNETLFGVTLPRGLTLISKSQYTCIYRSTRAASGAYDRYFSARLLPTSIQRSLSGSVTLDMARPRENPRATPVTVRIVPLRGSLTAAEVNVHQAEPAPPAMTQAQVEAKIRQDEKWSR